MIVWVGDISVEASRCTHTAFIVELWGGSLILRSLDGSGTGTGSLQASDLRSGWLASPTHLRDVGATIGKGILHCYTNVARGFGMTIVIVG